MVGDCIVDSGLSVIRIVDEQREHLSAFIPTEVGYSLP